MSYDTVINKLKKDWNCAGLMDGAHAARGEKIPFSSPLLNHATYGGVPRGRITEFYGEPGGGKTTSSIDICKNGKAIFDAEYEEELSKLRDAFAQGSKQASAELQDLEDRGPKKVLYVDLEHSFDEAWAETLGVSLNDDSDIQIMQPPDVSAEDILQAVQSLIETGEIGLLVLDSIPSLVPKSELEKKYGERTVAALAGLLTVFCRKILPVLTRYDCTMILINQTRDNMDNPYVIKTPGGNAIKFYASLRMYFRIGPPIDFLGNELPQSSENPAGYKINVKITKQKTAPFDRKIASYHLMANSGIRVDMDLASLAVNKYQIIKKSGAWYTICNPETKEPLEDAEGKLLRVQGMAKVFDYLQQNTEYFNQLRAYILKDIEGEDANIIESEEGSDVN